MITEMTNGFPTLDNVAWCVKHDQHVIEIHAQRKSTLTHGTLGLSVQVDARDMSFTSLAALQARMTADIGVGSTPPADGYELHWSWASWKKWAPS